MLLASFQLEYSYNQFLVFDAEVKLPGNEWTQVHVDQGFARRDSSVNFETIFQFGVAETEVFDDDYVPDGTDERVISVPFHCSSGKVLIEGPEAAGSAVSLLTGPYRLTAAQGRTRGREELSIRLFFRRVENAISSSEILLRDDELNPPNVLLEHSEVIKV